MKKRLCRDGDDQEGEEWNHRSGSYKIPRTGLDDSLSSSSDAFLTEDEEHEGEWDDHRTGSRRQRIPNSYSDASLAPSYRPHLPLPSALPFNHPDYDIHTNKLVMLLGQDSSLGSELAFGQDISPSPLTPAQFEMLAEG